MNEELKIIISAEIKKLKDNVKSAKKSIQDFTEKTQKDVEEATAAFDKMGGGIKKGLAIGATAMAGAATALLALADSTAEYRNSQAQLVTAFEAAGGSATEAKGAYNDLYRVLGDGGQATEAAQHLAKLTTNEKELSEWTNICQGIYATFGASLPIEGLTEAANETAKVGQVTGGLADALNWAGISEDAFNEKLAACNTEAEREKLIRETLNKVYDDAAAKYEKNNADILAQNEAQAKLDETMASLGETLAPIITTLTSLANDVLSAISPYLQEFADKYLPDIEKTLDKVGGYVGDVISWIVDNWSTIKTVATVVGAIAAAILLVNGALTAYTTVMGIANAVMSASPITWIIVGITALIAAIVLCIVYWDEISAAIKKAWEAIKEAVGKGVDSAKEKVKSGFAWIKEKIITPVKEAYNTVKQTFTNISNSIGEKIDSAKTKVKSAIDKIKGFFNFKWDLPKIKTPSLSITWSQSPGWMAEAAKLVGLQGVPKFSVSWNALGGVFDKPTLFGYGSSLQGIGEDGAEAVVPLEKNTQWLNKLANMLNDKMGARPVILMVDKRVLAQTSVEGINDITRATGSIPLVIA
jgi:hypothetical protein